MQGRFVIASVLLTGVACAQPVEDIAYRSAADGTMQRAMWMSPSGDKPAPLVVALHTWSGDYRQQNYEAIRAWCEQQGWAYIHPDFRGPCKRPEATGSELVVADIVSAVEFAKGAVKIDASRVYLVGSSGGGYHCLVMAGKRPDLWAGVSAWVPISDLRAWYEQGRYREDLVASCGGKPGDSAEVDAKYRQRSPLTYLARAKGKVRLHISAGIRDGHTGSVPVSHSLRAFNEVADEADRIPEEEIAFFVEKAQVPEHLRSEIADASYGEKGPLFRRTSATATVTVFDGGHEIVCEAAIAWIEELDKARR